jgi:2-keto-4-pentenoate hydratase/2-oxohepta-3-ene-1,7-dioic acid hydratase in catechol pathway
LVAGKDDDIHYETEISFIIKNNQYVGVGLDLTKRDLQTILREKGQPWEHTKAFDAAAVYGDFVGSHS